jgi:hypothetical protein
MAIVVDDFQLEPAPAQPQTQTRGEGGGEGGKGSGGKQPDPEEIERAFRAQAERAVRVWAH